MQNPPKRWEIFTSKKGCESVYGFPKLSGYLAEKWWWKWWWWCGSAGGEDESREKHMIEWKKKERKEVKWKSRPREKMDSVKMSGWEWWVVGLGGGHVGVKKIWP